MKARGTRCRRRDKSRRWKSAARFSDRGSRDVKTWSVAPARGATPPRSPPRAARDWFPRRRPVLDHAQKRRRGFLSPARPHRCGGFCPSSQTRRKPCCFNVARARGERRPVGHRHGKSHEHFLPRARGQDLRGDLRRAERPHGPAAMGAGQRREPSEEQLQVIGDLGHGADGAARGLDRVALLNGDGGGQAIDAVDVGLVHPLQKLARVGRESLDVTALALGEERVEGERRFARAAQAGDDGQPRGAEYRRRCS